LEEKPAAVFMGGDLLPHHVHQSHEGSKPIRNFVFDFLFPEIIELQTSLGGNLPRFFIILGNDDLKTAESDLKQGESEGLWEYIHNRKVNFGDHAVYGYNCVPPTPFQLKDWERYDVSRYLDPGCIAPEDGWHSDALQQTGAQFTTIQEDLRQLVGEDDLSRAILLFHAPPYQTVLDRAELDGQYIDHVPLDVHVGSIAIRRLIEERQPLATLHGHIHESARMTGKWFEQIGSTHSFSAAHDGPELALVRFDPGRLDAATRDVIDR
jgi:Icc-related predicted phosphoesterase